MGEGLFHRLAGGGDDRLLGDADGAARDRWHRAADWRLTRRARSVRQKKIRMQFCGGWHEARWNTTELPPLCADFRRFASEITKPFEFCTAAFFRSRLIVSRDQTVAVAMPNAHDSVRKFCKAQAHPSSTRARSVLAFDLRNKGGTTVDLTLRLNLLAVCAAFVFVGAVLLGAF